MSNEDEKSTGLIGAGALISDLSGLGRPATALIENISKGLGRIYLPRAIREEGKARAEVDMYMADAEAYRVERLASAEIAKKRILETERDGLLHRAGLRVREKETTRQYNLEQTVSTALALVEREDPEATVEDISQDWIERYLDYIEVVSDPDIQMIWARILARKVSDRKRSVSLMTLDSLRLIEFDHAVTFDVVARCCATFGSIIITSHNFSSINLGVNELSALEALGFIDKKPYTEFAIPLQVGLILTAQGEPQKKQTRKLLEGAPEYRLTFRGRELAGVIIPQYEQANDLIAANPYVFLDAERQARILAQWAIHYVSFGMEPTIVATLGSKEDISKRKKSFPRLATHQWDQQAQGWRRLPDAEKFETPELIHLFEIGET